MGVGVVKEDGAKISLRCSFCRGKGIDPFELLSKLSVCQVCLGRGEVTVQKPVIECVCCSGTGIQRHRRLTCTVCGGKGMVNIRKPVETCPRCFGRGIVEGDYLPCSKCRGKGVVAKK